jgi:putative nucleotidyltransferase with HDIG domain
VVVACAGLAASVSWAVLVAHSDNSGPLSVILAIAAIVAGLGHVRATGKATISASFLVVMLAAAFLGPTSAFSAEALASVAGIRLGRTRWSAFVINLFANGFTFLVLGTILQKWAPRDHRALTFYLLIAAAVFGALVLSWAILAPLHVALNGTREGWHIRVWKDYLPSILINLALAVAGAAVYVTLGIAGITFALVGVAAFHYMSYLVSKAQQRSEAHAALSWGVLAGLMRSLHIRDQRAARHAAAVAKFARDMASAVGMGPEESELAHTAGLLHDIGHFALSDRVAERGRKLTDEDWLAIQRHPELGADMLRDLGLYGPVAEIVLAHHERIDGRGYPNGLTEQEIPEIAKIIAVAEAYDTLTASDTYRTRMSSFEALRELRRVADTQLDSRYVEILAELLTGVGVEYRHADAADFDTELDMERRIREARAAG